MVNPLQQTPLDKYFVSPTVNHVSQRRRKKKLIISGISKFMKYLSIPKNENGIFITRMIKEEDLRETFIKYGMIKDIRIFKRYSFVIFDDDVDINSIIEKYHLINGRSIYIDRIKSNDPNFISLRNKKRINLWYDYNDKFN